jgi:hypothetical protein
LSSGRRWWAIGSVLSRDDSINSKCEGNSSKESAMCFRNLENFNVNTEDQMVAQNDK